MTQSPQEYLKSQDVHLVDELLEFLRIPSVSTDPAQRAGVDAAASWVADQLQRAGPLRVETFPTAGHPVVYAEWLGAPGKPTVLVYGHYDVQPVDPLDLWTSPPFEPEVRDGKLFARGAVDDKGQVMMHLKAFEAHLATRGSLPLNVKYLIEGEEEIGSPNFDDF